MRPLEVLIAVLAALPALSVSEINYYFPHCADDLTELNREVLYNTGLEVTCGQQPPEIHPFDWLDSCCTTYPSIVCSKETEDYTCEDIPEFGYAHNDTKELTFEDCPMTFISIACVERRLGVRGALKLTVIRPVYSYRWLREDLEGLQGSRWIEFIGKGDRDRKTIITNDALAHLSALERLEISSLRLRLAPRALAGLRALTHLDLNSTSLSERDLLQGALANLPALTHLSLYRNNIKNITYDTFQNLTSLEQLDVSFNELSSLDGAVLAAGCPRLRELYVESNPLVELRPLGPLQHLEKLRISSFSTFIMKVSPRALGALPQLAHVVMRRCYVRTLSADLFAGSKSLLTLDLSKNELLALPASLFTDQRMLQNLDLSDNKLKTLSQELFSGLVGLQRLDLENNLLKELPDRLLESLPVLRSLQLLHNPLHCDCHLHPLALRMRQAAGNATLTRVEVDHAKCACPSSLRDRRLEEVELHELVCKTPAHCTSSSARHQPSSTSFVAGYVCTLAQIGLFMLLTLGYHVE